MLKSILRQGREIQTEDLSRVLKVVGEQVKRASGIINRLREFGRKPDFKKELVSVNTVLEEVMQLIGQQLTLQNIHVRYELAEDLPPILANANRLEQVVFNLVTNARDAIEQCPWDGSRSDRCRIQMSTQARDDRVVFTISDTGIGIPKGSLDKIFEPFYTTKEVGKGMGLGLAITYGIVREFGGSIQVESEAGKGTRFILSFPAAS